MATQFNLAPLSLKRTQAHTDAHRQARPHPSHQHLDIVLRILADKTPQYYMTWACCGIARYCRSTDLLAANNAYPAQAYGGTYGVSFRGIAGISNLCRVPQALFSTAACQHET